MEKLQNRMGRKSKDENTRVAWKHLTEAGRYAARKIFYAVRGKDDKGHLVKRLTGSEVKACELALAYSLGLPRQMIDIRHSIDMMTLRDLAQLAEERETKQLPVSQELLEQPAQDIIEEEAVAVSDKHSNQPDDTH